ncbi:hypothetical protein [Dendrosporobacter sp. 1207_IL3150]|uniref:hypothetical protein n=1 Tax=Dendrosporobacter sp. 1207_IL3150 TaxID=3084054 RepID=UPI002FDA60DA
MPNTKIDRSLIRTNCRVISSPLEPIYANLASVDPQSPIVVENLGAAYCKLGQRFNINTGAQNIENNSYLVVQITIPANWGKTLYFDKIQAGTSGTSVVDIIAASATTTDVITPVNTNLGSANTTLLTAGYAVTDTNPATNNPLLTFILVNGTYESNFEGEIIIPSTTAVQNYIIRVSNTGTENATCMATFSWWEV